MNDTSQPDDPHGTDPGQDEPDNLKTVREPAALTEASQDILDRQNSATLHGVNPPNERIVLDSNTIPGYDLLGELGRGGMGVVYKARDQKLKRIVALKMILSGAHASDEDMQRFQTEAEAVARLQHPNIVQVYEVAEHEGRPYIALEFADGGSLDQKINGVPQNVEESVELVETLCRAMDVAHENEIIHRDLKPANILLTADGEPKITDFGLAKRLDQDSNQTKSGAVIGTPSYMPPEQAANTTMALGPPADVYALGAILYHLLTGRPPFQAETQLDTIMQVITDEPVSPRKLNTSLPIDLETITLKCLQKEIPRRYQSAKELADDLRRFQLDEPIEARPTSVVERGWKWGRRRPAVAGLLGVSLVALLALIIGGLWYNAQLKEQKNEALRQQMNAEDHQKFSEMQERIAKSARLEAEKKTAAALHSDYIATINLVDQDIKTLNYQSAQLRMERFDQRVTPGIPDPRGIEWNQLGNVAADSFIRIEEEKKYRITSFDATPSADVVLYNIDWRRPVEEIPDINQLRIYDAVHRRHLSDELLTHPALNTTSRDGPVIRWISGRTFVIGNPVGLFALTVKEGLDETVSGDIKVLARGETYEITRTSTPGEFVVASVLPEDASSPVIRITTWQLNEGDEGITFTPGERTYPLDNGENSNMEVTSMAVSPDRRYLAVARGESVIVRDFTTGELLSNTAAQPRRNTPNSIVKAVTFLDTSSGLLLAIGGHNKMIEVFKIAEDDRSLVPQRELRGHQSFIQGLSYDRESGWLLSASNDRSIFCWSPLSGERHFVLDEHEAEVINVAFTDKGRFILSASFDSSLVIRERGRIDRLVLEDQEAFSHLKPASICFLPKTRQLLISGSGKDGNLKGSLSLLDWDKRAILDTLYLGAHPRIAEPHPSGTFVLIPLLNGELIRCAVAGDSLEASSVDLALDNGEQEIVITRADAVVHVPALDCFYMILQIENDRRSLARIDGNGRTGHILDLEIPQRAFSLAVSSSGDQLAVGTGRGASGFSEVYTIQTGGTEKITHILTTGFPSSISSIQFHPDGRSIYVAGDKKDIEHYRLSRPVDPTADLDGGNPSILYGHFYFVQKLRISESGRRLISLGADGLLCLWDLESGQMLTKREFTSQGVRNMAQDHAGGALLLLIDNQIMVIRH